MKGSVTIGCADLVHLIFPCIGCPCRSGSRLFLSPPPRSSLPARAPFLKADDHSHTVFCLLLNKVQFVTDSHQISIATLSVSRAKLCEILAVRVLRGWSERSLALATVLLTPWPLFRGAPDEVIRGAKEDGEEEALDDTGTALEVSVGTECGGRYTPPCQVAVSTAGISWDARTVS